MGRLEKSDNSIEIIPSESERVKHDAALGWILSSIIADIILSTRRRLNEATYIPYKSGV